mmetsp:Transcript_139860/g.447295  ORF Transcript_139860/g.447295 Transcript_139860/m.447295 type:complete len:239 (-) Transcript_139860:4-720(-)
MPRRAQLLKRLLARSQPRPLPRALLLADALRGLPAPLSPSSIGRASGASGPRVLLAIWSPRKVHVLFGHCSAHELKRSPRWRHPLRLAPPDLEGLEERERGQRWRHGRGRHGAEGGAGRGEVRGLIPQSGFTSAADATAAVAATPAAVGQQSAKAASIGGHCSRPLARLLPNAGRALQQLRLLGAALVGQRGEAGEGPAGRAGEGHGPCSKRQGQKGPCGRYTPPQGSGTVEGKTRNA